MPTARVTASSGVIDGKLYVVGGTNGSDLSSLEVYDPVTDTWTTKTPMLTARSRASAGVINGKLFVAGGTNGADLSLLQVYAP